MKTIIELENLTIEALEGVESPLEAFVEIKKAIDLLTELQNAVKQEALNEASKENETTFENYGAKITYKEGRRTWDFKGIDSWKEADKKRKEIEELHKSAYNNYQKGKTTIDENGEVVKPAICKFSSPSISVVYEK